MGLPSAALQSDRAIVMNDKYATLNLKYLGIDTYKDPIIYMRGDSNICKSEGFIAPALVRISLEESFHYCHSKYY